MRSLQSQLGFRNNPIVQHYPDIDKARPPRGAVDGRAPAEADGACQKERESFAPRPSSPPSSCRTFPSRLRANLKVSRLAKRGEYRAARTYLAKS